MRRYMAAAVAAAMALASLACGSDAPAAPSAPVFAQYGGTYSGTYTVTACNQSGGVALANICGSLGGSAPYGFKLTQSGASVTGSFTLGTIQFPNVGGTVGTDTSLGLNGTSVSNGITVVVTWALHNTGGITGTVTQVWQSNVLSGQATVVGTIATATRTAGLPSAASFGSVADFVRGAAGR